MAEEAERKISAHRMTATLASGEVLELVSANPDMVRFDITRQKHKWPGPEDAAVLWATFVAWAAARRTGVYAGTWEKWADEDCLELEFDDDDEAEVDPTQPGAEFDSVSP